MDRETFLSDEKTKDAVSKCAEAVGNAARQVLAIEPDFDKRHPSARLASAYASRNRLTHGYFSIDYDVLWVTASHSIPATVEAARKAILKAHAAGREGGAVANIDPK